MSVVASSLPHSRASLRARIGASNERSVVAIGRGTLIGAGVVLCGLAAWAAGATWWLVNHDAIAVGFLKRQTALQYAYEDRIAALRAQIDRVASQRLLEQDGLDGARLDGERVRGSLIRRPGPSCPSCSGCLSALRPF